MALHTNGRRVDLVQYTLATLPSAADYELGSLIYVTDANSGVGGVAVLIALAAGSPTAEGTWCDLVDYTVIA